MLPPFVCSQEIHAPPCSCLQACKCVTTEPRVSQESVSIKMGTLTLRCAAHHLLELPVPLADTHILSELNPSFCALAVHLWFHASQMNVKYIVCETSTQCLLKVQGPEHKRMFSIGNTLPDRWNGSHWQLWIVGRLFCATEMLHTKKRCPSYT